MPRIPDFRGESSKRVDPHEFAGVGIPGLSGRDDTQQVCVGWKRE
jgi:hypothetical protein